MSIKVALAGNPNCGKTTLFNALTGANQYVGNWPGVTVEKKEGKWKQDKSVTIVDLPGIYSLSPYTLEEVVSRRFLLQERPDVILNLVDGTNLERNLYLTTQLLELGIPVVIAVNMMDLVQKNGDVLDIGKLSEHLGCPVMEISALKGTGIHEAAALAVQAGASGKAPECKHRFSGAVETALAEIAAKLSGNIPAAQQRFFAIKALERDSKLAENIEIPPDVEPIIVKLEEAEDDDAESIITNERYQYISGMIADCYQHKSKRKSSVSDKIDRVVTNRWAALPIFAAVMFIIYYISVTTVGTIFTDWMNDGVFGDGWHLLGIGQSSYEDAGAEYEAQQALINGYLGSAAEAGVPNAEAAQAALSFDAAEYETEAAAAKAQAQADADLQAFLQAAEQQKFVGIAEMVEDGDTLEMAYPDLVNAETGAEIDPEAVTAADFAAALTAEEPSPYDYGPYIPGIPVLLGNLLDAVHCVDWLQSLILDGIVGGVGAVLGFVPQILVLFIFLGLLESCGYLSRVAFILDRIFRKFGLSGKGFIPMLIGTGCGIPGIMASRTIENEKDRRMSIITTTFMPCSAKLPIIATIAGACFHNAGWVAVSMYFIGIAAIIVTGVMLKKTKLFSGDPAPFVMELPAYHVPTVGAVARSMWERGWSFIKKAGTIILGSTIVIWFLMSFGWTEAGFGMVGEAADGSILAYIGKGISWIFHPLGWGDSWEAAVATINGLVAKENVVGTMGSIFSATGYDNAWIGLGTVLPTGLIAFSFMLFNMLCAPCFAAMGAIRREMNNGKWFLFAIAYQTLFAYAIALIVYQLGTLFTGGGYDMIWTSIAIAVCAGMLFQLFRPQQKRLSRKTSAALE